MSTGWKCVQIWSGLIFIHFYYLWDFMIYEELEVADGLIQHLNASLGEYNWVELINWYQWLVFVMFDHWYCNDQYLKKFAYINIKPLYIKPQMKRMFPLEWQGISPWRIWQNFAQKNCTTISRQKISCLQLNSSVTINIWWQFSIVFWNVSTFEPVHFGIFLSYHMLWYLFLHCKISQFNNERIPMFMIRL